MKVASPAELERDWTLAEVVTAHGILDGLDKARARARAKAEREARRSDAMRQRPGR